MHEKRVPDVDFADAKLLDQLEPNVQLIGCEGGPVCMRGGGAASVFDAVIVVVW